MPGFSIWDLFTTPNSGVTATQPMASTNILAAAMAVIDSSTETGWVFPEARRTLQDALSNNYTSLLTVANHMGFNGTSWDRFRLPNVIKDIPATAITAATPVTIWTPAAGKKFRLMGWVLSLSVAGGVILLDNAAGNFVPGGRTPLMAAGVGMVSPPMGNGFLSAAANNVLKADVTATGSIQGYVFGTEE